MKTRIPAEVFPPGDFLREELEARGWTQADFAQIIGRDITLVNQIVQGKRAITAETAYGFAAAFGTSPEFWIRLEEAYQLWRVTEKNSDAIALKARIYSSAPILQMVRRGWLEASENAEVLEKRLLSFNEADCLEDTDSAFSHAARKSSSYKEPTTPAQRAWLCRAKQMARTIQHAPFTGESVSKACELMRPLALKPDEISHVSRILNENGIRLVIVEPLAGNKIDGACFWLDDAPTIALSMRFNRVDNFWFTLLHELGHCNQKEDFIDIDMASSKSNTEKPESERQADEFALNCLIDQGVLTNFIMRKRPLYSTRSIVEFAEINGVHPGIVVGQLQYRGEISWEQFRKMLVPVREYAAAGTLTDGWVSTSERHPAKNK